MFSLLSEVYKLSADLDQKDVIRLSDNLIDELYTCVVLAPMAVADLRAQFSEDLYMTDASDWGEAVVNTQIGGTMFKEKLRHSLNKPCWTRLLTPFKAMPRTKGVPHAGHRLNRASWTFFQERKVLQEQLLKLVPRGCCVLN